MATFYIITIFPESIENYFNSSILRRAKEQNIININLVDLKDFGESKNGFRKLDDKPFGGGPGMVLKIEPILKAVEPILKKLKNKKKTKIIIFSPSGKQFAQKTARDWAKKYEDIIMICGRYEGMDARAKKAISSLGIRVEEISIGDYILTGGELPAAVVVDAVSRHVPGVLGKSESLEDKRGGGYPLYTKPESFEHEGRKYKTPKVLLSGHHEKIKEWRKKHSKKSKNCG